MTDGLWPTAAGWAVPTGLAGTAVFGLAVAAARTTKLPAARERAAAWAVQIGLLAAVLAAVVPAWVSVPVPAWAAPAKKTTAPAAHPEPPAADPVRVADAGPQDARHVFHPMVDEATDVPLNYSPEPEPPAPAPPRAEPPPAPPVRRGRIADGLTALYLLVAGGLLVRLAAAHLGLARLVARSAPAPARLTALAAGLPGYSPRVRLRVTDRLPSPVCFGLMKPTILVPRALSAAGTDEQLKWVLGHELDHLRRGDPWTGLWAGLAGCLFFPLPFYWVVRRELRLAQEQLADAAATAAGGRAVDYAAFLVGMAGPAAAVRGERLPIRPARSDLYRRVTMLLDANKQPAGGVSRRWTALTAGGMLGAGVLLSGVGLAADEPPAKADPRHTPAARLLRAERLAVMPDGPPAAEAEIRRLEKALDGLQKTADELKDAPEARAAIERTIAEYKRRIAEAKAKGELMPPPVPPAAGGDAAARMRERLHDSLRRQQDQMAKATDAVLKAYEQQLQAADDPVRRKALEQTIEAFKAAREAAQQQFQAPPLLFARPDVRAWNLDGQQLAFPQGQGMVFGKGRLGVTLGPIPDVLLAQFEDLKDKGQLITAVADGSVAAKAGVRVNDVLLSVAGKPVSADPTEVVKQVADMKAGEPFDLVVLRKGQKQTLKGLVLAEAKAEPRAKRDGPAEPDGPKVSSVSVSVTDDEFTIKAEQDGVRYLLTGTITDGKPVPATITVRQGDKKSEYPSLEKMPKEQREAAEALLKRVSGSK